MNVTRTPNNTVTYRVSTPNRNAPSDRDRDYHDFFEVYFQNQEVTEIKLPHSVSGGILHARDLLMIKKVLAQLETEGYSLSYKETN